MTISAKDLKELSSNLTILYAEDEEILRDSMQVTLEKLFKKTLVAKNGQEAFEMYKKEASIDIVLTDINMPIMGGLELITRINETGDDPAIIVLSAHDESKLLQTLINMGVNNFLNKPLEKEALIKILYRNCESIENKKLLKQYADQLEEDNIAMARKNQILEQKLKQLANQTNKAENLGSTQKASHSEKEEGYFKILLQDERDELKDLSQELDTYIMMMFQNDKKLNKDYIYKLAYVYQKYAAVLNSYSEFYELSHFLREFSETITTLEDKFLKELNQTGVYFESLQMTLETFRQNVWEKEAKDPRFYNASLKNDIQLVIDFLQDREAEENEIEFF